MSGDDDRDVLLVVLGAGASFDCLPTGLSDDHQVQVAGLPDLPLRHARPPLTQALTQPAPLPNWALGRWPAAQPVISRLRRVLGDGREAVISLEEALAEIALEAGRRPDLARALLATQFFMADMIWAASTYMLSPALNGGMTNYVDLVDMLLTWVSRDDAARRAVVVSFNYDPLLEVAVENALGVKITLDQPAPDPRLTVLKPHGSARWGWLAPGFQGTVSGAADDRRRLICDSLDMMTPDRSQPLRMIDAPSFAGGVDRGSEKPAVPALALPVASKSDFVWAPAHGQAFASLRGRVSRLVAIGWRGMEPHFTGLLRDKVKEYARAMVVTGGDDHRQAEAEAAEIVERLSGQTDSHRSNWSTRTDGFCSLVAWRNDLLEFLEMPDTRPAW